MAISGTTFSPSDTKLKDEIKKSQKNADDIREKPIMNIEQQLKDSFLTNRQIAKKLIMMQTPGIDEETAQLIVYGKIYYKDGKLYDNDKLDPNCLSQPNDEDYEPPLDENSPAFADIETKKTEVLKSVKELGIKAKELIVAEVQCMIEITSSLISMGAAAVIMPLGSGLPVAFASLQTMISSIKRLQSKTGEITPLFKPLEYLSLLLPATAQGIVALVTGIVTLIVKTLGLIAGVMSVFSSAEASIPKELPKQEIKVEPKAEPNIISFNTSSKLTANASGGDWQYTYLWESNPIGFTSTEKEVIVNPQSTTTYTCKVTDGKGKGSSKSADIIVEVF